MSARPTLSGARALVTGGTGFIGSRLVGRLLALGCEVHATGRDGARLGGLPVALHEAPLGYELFKHKKDDCLKVVLKP